ncbi:MAG: NERD domain-containing protein [Chloroflexota bacterium]|nr:MAG: hypothetical protein DIU68_08890 [Chloroflexota bacterium]
MKARLIQKEKLKDHNKAEKAMLRLLEGLPEGYTIYRELKLTRAYEDRVRGLEKAQPDFVVVGPAIGVLSIEVKDWNLDSNRYTWRDQITVLKQAVGSDVVEELHNPADQADTYLHALRELISGTNVFVTSIVAFPRQSRQAFLNRVANIDVIKKPQSKFLLNLETTIFWEEVDQYLTDPEALLKRIVRKHPAFRQPSESELLAVHDRLLPNSFRIGEFGNREKARKQLKLITEEQEKWIFGLERPQNYLLDVAGSGKTNALVSRALHIIEQAHKQRQTPPNILITTYNPNLQVNIQWILDEKVRNPEERHTRYGTLRVENVETIMQSIACAAYGCASIDEYHKLNNPASKDYQQILSDDVQTALKETPDKFRIYDYIFIDEIQDFDDLQLDLIRRLSKTDFFFFVGDIGQKLYDRYHNLRRHGFFIEELELPKTYKMYRTPRYIGELAFRFIMADNVIREEFEQHGYKQDTQFKALIDNGAELLRATEPLSAIMERINALLSGSCTEDDIMVITSEQELPKYAEAFERAHISFNVGHPKTEGRIALLDFMNVKGLEREVVIISGIEDLYNRSKPEAMFDDPASQQKKERFSRRKIYVALTRTIHDCIIFYSNPTNPFVSELLRLNRQIMAKRQAVK